MSGKHRVLAWYLCLLASAAACRADTLPRLPADSANTSAEPIEAPELQWQWVEFAGAQCRDGSPAGLSVNFSKRSRKLMLYLEGGGSCYDVSTCTANPASVVGRVPGNAGIFDRANPQNPVGDWNLVYVPYCTGDVHMGDTENATVPGVAELQQFVGRRNLGLFLERLRPSFANASQVLLTGVSAGGVGALMNYQFVQNAFGAIPVAMIDDSGPVMSTRYVPSCLNQRRRKLWGLDKTILQLCGSQCDPDGDFQLEYVRYVMSSGSQQSGLIESIHDEVIRSYYGIGTNNGKNDCQGTLGASPMDPEQFEAGLRDTRAQLQQVSSRFGTFYPAGTEHGWITDPAFYTQTADSGVKMVDWFRAVLENRPATQLGP